jgi:GDP-L-fucose synthase
VAEKALITGGTGFVGSHLREELDRRGVPHVVFSRAQCDLRSAPETDALFREHRDATLILHLASVQAAGLFPARFPADQFHANHLIHVNVLRAWKAHLPRARFVGIGSSCAYPGTDARLVEERILDGATHGSVYSYATTKRALLVGIQAYNAQYGLDGSYLVPPTLFGEGDDFHSETAHVAGALVGRMVRAVRDGAPAVEIWGDGTQVREFLYVKDFVSTLWDVALRCHRDVVNVGPGRGTSIRELADMIRAAAGYCGELAFNEQRYTGIREKVLDTTRLARVYGQAPTSDLRPGIERTVRWYEDNYERIKDRRKFADPEPALA